MSRIAMQEAVPWTAERDWQLSDYLATVDKREADADKRSAALVRAHEQGWKLVADAITKGLGQVAEAIRQHGRG